MGNCQTVALCDYISRTPARPDCKWLCVKQKWKEWSDNTNIFGLHQVGRNIYDSKKFVDIMIQSDYIVYQPHWDTKQLIKKISDKNEHLLFITLTPIFVNKTDFMKRKEKKYNCKISCCNIIKNNKHKTLFLKNDNHPTTFLYLEIIKQICNIISIPFFTDSEYIDLLKIQYPNYQ